MAGGRGSLLIALESDMLMAILLNYCLPSLVVYTRAAGMITQLASSAECSLRFPCD